MSVLNPVTMLPHSGGALVTPDDAVRFEPSQIAILGAGNISVTTSDGQQLDIIGVPAGFTLPFLCVGVRATGTTATNIIRAS